MGSLRLAMPITCIMYCIASFSLMGLPYFTGFFSKEAILEQSILWTYNKPSYYMLVPILAFTGVFLTSFYVCRQLYYVFFKTSEVNFRKERANLIQFIPMMVLVLLSLYTIPTFNHLSHISIFWPTLIISFAGFFLMYLVFVHKSLRLFSSNAGIVVFIRNGFYLDALYQNVFVKPILLLSVIMQKIDFYAFDGIVNFVAVLGKTIAQFSAWIDRVIVDGFVNAIAKLARRTGDFIRAFQTGKIQSYFVLSIILMVLFMYLLYK